MNRPHLVSGDPAIRLATAGDATAALACVSSAFSPYIERIGKTPAPMLLDYPALIGAGRVWLAEVDAQVAGVLVQYATPEGFYIDTVAAARAYRGTGVGRALLEFAEYEALRRGFTSLYLCANSRITENEVLYSKIGYVEYDRKSVPAGYDRVFYRKDLGVHVRDVNAGDFAEWLPLWEGYNAFYGRAGATALPMDITQLTWSRFLNPDEPMHALVAQRGGRIVGLTHYLFHRCMISVEPVCYLQDLYTLESERGRGIGRALIEAVYEKARAANAPRVYWQTHESNTAGRVLYDKLARHTGKIIYSRQL